MWFSFWKSRDRFSLGELRYLTDELQKVQIVNEANKDSVIEALRSIAELITYGDQHDSNFFEFFMEKQVMGEFVRIVRISKVGSVSLQLLQTVSIMIQNIKSEHAIYYMFSNEHINALITYSFDFRNEELLSYYISFLRAISGKLNQNTISLLVKTQNDEVVSFPLYTEAIRFAFHEENMIRTAVRALTLNVYHVGDDSVNSFIIKAPHAEYFSNLVRFFQKQCNYLNGLVSGSVKIGDMDGTTAILAAVDEIEDNLFYFSDIISAGIPDVGKLISDKIFRLLVLPMLLPSLWSDVANDIQIDAITSLYLVCCTLRILKIKDLANTIAAAFFCPPESFVPHSQAKVNGYLSNNSLAHEESEDQAPAVDVHSEMRISNLSCSTEVNHEGALKNDSGGSHLTLWDVLLSYITTGDDLQVQGALCVLATLLQTKELDETMLDALGILPQRKHHKKLLLQVLVGEGSGEEQLFSPESSYSRDGFSSELDCYLQRLKAQYKVAFPSPDIVTNLNSHRFQVLDTLFCLFCRSNISAETLWDGGWLLRQLLPYSETEFNCEHLKLLKESYKNSCSALFKETKGIWPDVLITALCDEWKKCKRAIEASSPREEPKYILMPIQRLTSEEALPGASSFVAGERMYELVKAFILLHQLQIFSLGRALPDQPPIHSAADIPQNSRSRNAGLNASDPKPGVEIQLVGAMPCRIAFERGKERHFWFVAISKGVSGWILLAEELPLKQNHGVIRVSAPLAGCNPRMDEKHSRWLHLRIRPSTLPFGELGRPNTHGKVKTKSLVDGRWTLAFRDEESCKSAFSMVLEEMDLQSNEVGRRIKPLLNLEDVDVSDSSPQASSSRGTPKSF